MDTDNFAYAAERLHDEVHLFDPNELRYVGGKIEVAVGHWAWRRLREMVNNEHDLMDKQAKELTRKALIKYGDIDVK